MRRIRIIHRPGQGRKKKSAGYAPLIFLALFGVLGWNVLFNSSERTAEDPDEIRRQLLEVAPPAERRDGIAVAVMLDTSGSMNGRVDSPAGAQPKINIAREAAAEVVRQISTFAQSSEVPVEVGVYAFSGSSADDTAAVR